jgi:hypothetical protein
LICYFYFFLTFDIFLFGGAVPDASFYEEFAVEWLAAWNTHDLERILALYEESFEFSSPVLARVNPSSGGKLVGKQAARVYWSKGLAARPDLHFEHIVSLHGVQSMVIHYKGLGGKLCAEFFAFSGNGKIAISHAHEYTAKAALEG